MRVRRFPIVRFLRVAFAALVLGGLDLSRAGAVESIHFGYNAGHLTMTDSLRLSSRVGTVYWSQNSRKPNPENGATIPYAYHDGYIEDLGTPQIPTSAALAQRWREIMTGQGDSRTGVSGAAIGVPDMIILDELNSNFRDHLRGPLFREALRLYTLPVAHGGFGGSTNDIVAFIQPGVTQGPGVGNGQYSDVIYAANHYMRGLALEMYTTHSGYLTGIESPTNQTQYPTGDAYLAQRLTGPLRNWLNAGLGALQAMPILSVSNIADAAGHDFNAFLNRQFWFMANGRYSTNPAQIDVRIRNAMRQGVGSYTWTPDVDGTDAPYRLDVNVTTRDAYFEAFLKWYSVDGNTALHNMVVDPTFDSADFTKNGVVDGADLAKWMLDFGGGGSDADGDGDSDGADFLLWQRRVGNVWPATVAAQIVPEPAAGTLATVAAVCGWALSPKRRSR